MFISWAVRSCQSNGAGCDFYGGEFRFRVLIERLQLQLQLRIRVY